MFTRLFGHSEASIPTMSPRDAWKLYSTTKDVTLIDVREGWEFARGHAKGARNIPLSQFGRHLEEIAQDQDVMLICQSGHRSLQAARLLKGHGHPRVVNISGGTTIWRMSQLPME